MRPPPPFRNNSSDCNCSRSNERKPTGATRQSKLSKNMNTEFVSTALALLALSTLSSPLSTAFAQGTAFTYQGRLNDGGPPANGTYDLRFSLFTTNSGGSLAYGFVTNSGIAISNGLFTVTMDFGSNVFDGTI